MKTRAAIAVAPNAPLEIHEGDLEGPKAGEVLVEIRATGICHTDAYTLEGKDSEGIFPSILGHEGAGIVREIGPGVTSVAVGDHVIPLYIAECRECPSCLSRKTNLCTAVRATQGKGVMPDGTSRFSLGGETIAHYMGCSTFSNFTVMPKTPLPRVREAAPFDKICYIGCGVTTGIGAAIWTAGVEPGSRVAVFGLGGDGLNVIQRARLAGAVKVVQAVIETTKGGADYTFDCTGNTDVMRQALESAHRGWGVSVVIGVAESDKEVATRPFQLITGRTWKGTAFGGARGRTDVPMIVDWYMDGKIAIDPLITHTMGLYQHTPALHTLH